MAALLPLFRYLLGSDRAWTYRALVASERMSALVFAGLAAAIEIMALHQSVPAVHFLATIAAVCAAWRGGRIGIVMASGALAAAAWMGGVFGPVRADVSLVQLHLALTVLLAQAVGFLRDGRHVLNERLRAAERELAGTRSTLRGAESLYRLLGEASRDVVLKTDLDGKVLYASPAVAAIAGEQAGSPLGRKVAELVDPTQAAMFEKRFETAMAERRDVAFDHLVFHHGGVEHWFDARIHCQRDDQGAAEGGVVILSGLNEKRALEDELVAATLRDPLTGLTNRATFTRMLAQHIETGGTGCLAKFDLDHFRAINQEHGNQVGDQVLVSFANLLRSLLREGDVIARVGGERFAVMLPSATADEAERVCSRIVSEMADIGAGSVAITASAGVSRIAATLDETMKNADRAVVVAKAKGRNRVEMDARRGVFPR
jgi:diguanylate cyclase (GGDEF)-like protein/PAS domain S-box-containing protein